MSAAEWTAEAGQRHRAPLRIVSAAAVPPRMRARDSGLRTVADELCGESARALSEAVSRSAEASSRLLIDASLLIGPPALAVTDSGAGGWRSHSKRQTCAGRAWSSSAPRTGSRPRPGGRPTRRGSRRRRTKPARVLACYSSRADLVVIGRHASSAGPAVGGQLELLFSDPHGGDDAVGGMRSARCEGRVNSPPLGAKAERAAFLTEPFPY